MDLERKEDDWVGEIERDCGLQMLLLLLLSEKDSVNLQQISPYKYKVEWISRGVASLDFNVISMKGRVF